MSIVNAIKTGAMATTFALGMASCQKAAKPIGETLPEVNRELTRIAKGTTRVLNDSSYHLFKRDTIEIAPDFLENPRKLMNKMRLKANEAVPKTPIGAYRSIEPMRKGNTQSHTSLVSNIYEVNYFNPRAVVVNPKAITKDSVKWFVPVEYYGQPNPKCKFEILGKNIDWFM